MAAPIGIALAAWLFAKLWTNPRCPFCTRPRMCTTCMRKLELHKQMTPPVLKYAGEKYVRPKRDKPKVAELKRRKA
jgi:hypothetical protein